MENILLPTTIEYTPGARSNEATVTITPFHQGYGTTIGNALRRVLLSSLPGAAVTAVKIKGVPHEFGTIPSVKEDVVQVILDLKQLRLKVFTEEEVRLSLHVKGEQEVTAADIDADANMEIMNKDLHLATLTDGKADLEMEIFVSQGRGFVPVEERDRKSLELGTIAIDAIYTPVRDVGYSVEFTRVGDITNYEKVTFKIETDGTISPAEAVRQATQIVIDHFSFVAGSEVLAAAAVLPMTVEEPAKKRGRKKKEEEVSVES